MNIKSNKYILILFLSTILTSCVAVTTYRALNAKKVRAERLIYQEKEILLVPIAHIGEKIFYKSLRDSIINWKNKNYRIYYEQASKNYQDLDIDSLAADTLFRKWRKIAGGNLGTREQLSDLNKSLKDKVLQPTWVKLGVDSNDLNADINLAIMIAKYEDLYGKVHLKDCDLETPIDSVYECGSPMRNDLLPIVLDLRNKYVAHLIKNAGDDKIVVIYGAMHMKGIKKLITEQGK